MIFFWAAIMLFLGDLIFLSYVVKAAVPYGDFEYPAVPSKDIFVPKLNESKLFKTNWRPKMTDFGLSSFLVFSLLVTNLSTFFDVSLLYFLVPTVLALLCIPAMALEVYVSLHSQFNFFSFLWQTLKNFFKNLGSCFVSKWHEYAAIFLLISIYVSSLYYFGSAILL